MGSKLPPNAATLAAAPDDARRPDDRSLLTGRQVAALDGCSEKTVRRAVTAGLPVAIRIDPGGRLLRITPGAHRAYRLAGGL